VFWFVTQGAPLSHNKIDVEIRFGSVGFPESLKTILVILKDRQLNVELRSRLKGILIREVQTI
jgi:hypothetical protein